MVRAKRSLGQNFLHDDSVIERIVGALSILPGDHVIEIGPGTGALTAKLLGHGARVTAIEFDRDMVAELKRRFPNATDLRVHRSDVLQVDFSDLVTGTAKLVGNLPYNISTPILQRLIEARDLFDTLVLMFQREVVERITAKAGSSERGYLSVLVENAFESERLFDVPPTAFAPMPKVWSSVVQLTPKRSRFDNGTKRLVSVAFTQKRKTILNNLKASYPNASEALNHAGIDPQRRAETVTIDEWIELGRAVSNG